MLTPTPPPTRIFLVEDDENDVALTLRTLRSTGLDKCVTVFRDGPELIDRLQAIREGRDPGPLPDLVLLDLKLPRMSGIEVLQWLRADPLTQGVDVIILTSSRQDGQIVDLHRLGILAYLEKPLTSQDFARTVAGLVPFNPPLNTQPQ